MGEGICVGHSERALNHYTGGYEASIVPPTEIMSSAYPSKVLFFSDKSSCVQLVQK